MICKYPPESRMHNACILCNEKDLCGDIHTMLYDVNPSYTIPMPKVEPPKGKLLSAEESEGESKTSGSTSGGSGH